MVALDRHFVLVGAKRRISGNPTVFEAPRNILAPVIDCHEQAVESMHRSHVGIAKNGTTIELYQSRGGKFAEEAVASCQHGFVGREGCDAHFYGFDTGEFQRAAGWHLQFALKIDSLDP